MRIHLSLISQEIIDEYDVMQYVEADGYIYVEITGTMYGLSANGRITNVDLQIIWKNTIITQQNEHQVNGNIEHI